MFLFVEHFSDFGVMVLLYWLIFDMVLVKTLLQEDNFDLIQKKRLQVKRKRVAVLVSYVVAFIGTQIMYFLWI